MEKSSSSISTSRNQSTPREHQIKEMKDKPEKAMGKRRGEAKDWGKDWER